ncbi:hypothetical protein P154DRAFT_501603 [Amniculicola lignicola CBS 123094]|uniref:Uncharacterized protein n=1 Tax=Amniculicola lignicola CBS 123094 TaxID=1392246 RepID=A0A6A5W120_9PLEO|nr:hypothetical protein P154DRAFT_501603 [Amniculicola lignicola CBS 123094]
MLDLPADVTGRAFKPIPALASSTSDVILLALTNRNYYRKPVLDAWFNATNCTTSTQDIIPTNCEATEPYSWLSCKEQYQMCLNDGTTCSPMTGLYSLDPDREGIKDEEKFGGLKLNAIQKPLYTLLWKALWVAQLNYQLGFVGRENLVASEYLWDGGFNFGISANLPENHWHTEIGNWMNTSLAMMQRTTLSFARPIEQSAGPDISNVEYFIRPTDSEGSQLCKKMMGKSTAHTSFSVLGLGLAIGVVILVILVNIVLPKLVSYIQKRSGKGLHRRLEWTETSAFQLQRMAAEGRGVGPWVARDDDVPMLKGGQMFNLTGASLKGKWGRAESYQMARRSFGSTEEIEMGGLSPGFEKGPADKKEAVRMRLLDE